MLSVAMRRARNRLSEAGLDSAEREAQRLAAHAIGATWGELWTRLREPVDPAELEGLVARRCDGEPLAYILGTAEFCGHAITVGPGVLIPRPETETLVDVALELMSGSDRLRVADVGTGSGAVAAAIMRARPDALVAATDVSEEALAYARANGVRNLVRADLLGSLRCLDLVVSNPPYVPAGRTDLVGCDVLREPPEAIFAGPTGDEVLLRIVREAPAALRDDGALALEVGTAGQAGRIEVALAGWGSCGVRADDYGRPRVVWARKPPR